MWKHAARHTGFETVEQRAHGAHVLAIAGGGAGVLCSGVSDLGGVGLVPVEICSNGRREVRVAPRKVPEAGRAALSWWQRRLKRRHVNAVHAVGGDLLPEARPSH